MSQQCFHFDFLHCIFLDVYKKIIKNINEIMRMFLRNSKANSYLTFIHFLDTKYGERNVIVSKYITRGRGNHIKTQQIQN